MVAKRMYDGGRMSLTGDRIQTELTSEPFLKLLFTSFLKLLFMDLAEIL